MRANAPRVGQIDGGKFRPWNRSRRQILATTLGILLIVGPSFLGALASSRPPVGRPDSTAEATHRENSLTKSRKLTTASAPAVPLPSTVQPWCSVRATGVPTQPILRAAEHFYATLAPDQQARSSFPTDEAAWVDLTDLRSSSRGELAVLAMPPAQRVAALALVETTLNAQGLDATEGIAGLKAALGRHAGDFAGDRFTLLGRPQLDEPWGWQLDSPQFIINVFIAGDQVVVTPTALGAESANHLAAVASRTRP